MSISTQLNASFNKEDVDLFIYFHLMICLIMRTIMLVKPSYNINTFYVKYYNMKSFFLKTLLECSFFKFFIFQ